jgi:hypothetical protein
MNQFIKIYKNLAANLGQFSGDFANLFPSQKNLWASFMFEKNFSRYAMKQKGFFMKTIRHTKITIEKRELKFVRTSGNVRRFCQICQIEAEHLPIAQMSVLLMVSERTLFRLAEFEMLHFAETTDGRLLICAASAANFEK